MDGIFLSDDLPAIEAAVWQLLESAVTSYKSPFHNGVVATVNGNMPELRTVVLRRLNSDQKELFFHTDVRSPKLIQLQQNTALSWLFYDPALQIQLRCYSVAHKGNRSTMFDYQTQKYY